MVDEGRQSIDDRDAELVGRPTYRLGLLEPPPAGEDRQAV